MWGTGMSRGRETIIRIYYTREKAIFNERKTNTYVYTHKPVRLLIFVRGASCGTGQELKYIDSQLAKALEISDCWVLSLK